MASLLYLIILPAAYAAAIISNIAMIAREYENIISERILALQFICGTLFTGIASIL